MTIEERNEIILQNVRLVSSIVTKMYRSPYAYYDKEDMYQQGILGLIKAVERFDPEKGFSFATYAVPMIQGEIMRFIRENSQAIRYARSDIDALSRINRLGKSIDELTAEDIKELELTGKNLAAVRSMYATSINSPVSDDSSSEFSDLIPDERISEIPDELQLEIIENIKNLVLSRMTDRQQDMIDEWYYSALIGMKPNQHYLGRKYGVSQAQASRVIRNFKITFAKKLRESGYVIPDCILNEK